MSVPITAPRDASGAQIMRAAVYTQFGPPEVIQVRTLARPAPLPDEIRVHIRATTVTAACGLMRRGDTVMARVVLGLFGPRKRFQIAGIEFAGTVDRVGRDVTQWAVGERVFGFAGFNVGTYAEYHCMRASSSIAHMPDDLSFEEAASLVDGPTTALHFLRDLAHVRPGERVLIIGASGSVGGAAVQVARSLGATVTGVCSGTNVELVRQLGAHQVIDYTRGDFTKLGQTYDVVFDAVTKSSFASVKACLAPGGRYMPTVARLRDYLLMGWTKFFGTRRVICGMSTEKRELLRVVKDMLKRGELRPVIDRRYPLDHIVQAHRYVDTGRKKGNVVIAMTESADT